MGAVATKTSADLRRRRLQTVVLAMVLFLASGASTLAISILIESNAPFDRAFERANGAHLVIDFDASVGEDALASSASAGSVTASAGPWPVASAGFLSWNGAFIDARTVSGRPQPDDSIDSVTLRAGRWWQSRGEVVIDQDMLPMLGIGIGDTLPVYPAPTGGPKRVSEGSGGVLIYPGGPESPPEALLAVTVVGIAASVSTPDVSLWMHPDDIATVSPTTPPSMQMLYRVAPSASAADLAAAVAEITADLPANAVASTLSYLDTRSSTEDTAQLYVPVLLAFAIFALAAAAFTIANVVSGVVLTSYRDIGVMKAVGFTPGQVTTILLAQILLPVIVGTIAGVATGTLASQPTIEATAQSFGLPGVFTPSSPAIVAVFVACVSVAIVAAIGPALRAGSLSTVGAISRGTMPSTRPGGGRLRRLGLRLPAPIPVRLGVAAGMAHPIRATMTLGALLVGVAAVVFASGLNLSLLRVFSQIERDTVTPVRAILVDQAADAAELTTMIASHASTAQVAAIGQGQVTARAFGQVQFVGYQDESSWLGYALIEGRWFTGPGEAVAPTATFTETGLHVGETLELVGSDGSVDVRLVGEILDINGDTSDGLVIRGTWSDLATLDQTADVSRWEIQPIADVQPHVLADAIRAMAVGQIEAFTINDSSSDPEFLLFLSVVTFMGVVLVAISLGGVFNTVLLETRQRTREMAVLKAVGLTPSQVVSMVVASVVPIGVVAGILGVPLGMVFQRAVISYLGATAGGTRIPESTFDVFPPVAVVGLALVGLAIAAVGAYAPAQRAARARIAPVLQAE
jgi:putative ABC transport system permease protein